jgi:hypothetical protein
MKTISIPLDVTILLDGPSGVSLYVAEDELPEYTVSLQELVTEYIDAFSKDDRIASEHEADTYALIKQLRTCIDMLVYVLPE